jgi:crotonobetainyl-CoA:carnitine CoA-transferase CaiB-like acyl-CoA transferase
MTGSLSGIRVLDLSRVLAGPYCTQMMGDLGAEIIKIEKPYAGDDTRTWGPPFLKDTHGNDTTESAYYLSINRNKKSVAVDIAQEDGQKIILALLESCDVLIENFKVDSLKKYGLDYESLREKFPRLIYCSITGYGQSGELAHEPGYDLVAQAMGGLMAATGEINGAPMKSGVAVSDIITGLHAGIGLLAALHHRTITNEGQHVDVALLDCTLATMTNLAQYYLTSGKPAARQGNAHSTITPYQAFEARDGWFVIAVGNDHQFEKLAQFLNHPEWSTNEKFKTNSARTKNRDDLIPLIAAELKTYDVKPLITTLRDLDIPAGPVNRIDQSFAEPQVLHRGMRISLPHAEAPSPVELVGSPLHLSETPPTYHSAPPVLGQHTREVLAGILGLTPEAIKNLADRKIIQVPQS